MFSDEVKTKLKWHANVGFLHSVADIPFVCTEQQPKYEWISPAAPVRNFCDHESEVLQTFKTRHRFLPDSFMHDKPHSKTWLTFFKQIGLKCYRNN